MGGIVSVSHFLVPLQEPGFTESDITRLRNRFGFRYDFTDKLKLSIYDELLFNITGTTTDPLFDHDRLGLSLEYKLLPNLKFECLPIKTQSNNSYYAVIALINVFVGFQDIALDFPGSG